MLSVVAPIQVALNGLGLMAVVVGALHLIGPPSDWEPPLERAYLRAGAGSAVRGNPVLPYSVDFLMSVVDGVNDGFSSIVSLSPVIASR